jgi:hypothetical protein
VNKTRLPKPVPLTKEQFAKVRKMAKTCPNRPFGTNCLYLDDGDPCDCPQAVDASLECRYFTKYILPENTELYIQLMEPGATDTSSTRTCALCGKTFKTTSAAAKYCPDCRPKAKRQNARERQRRKRG